MEIRSLIANLGGGVTLPKTAAAPPSESAPTPAPLDAAMRSVLDAVGTAKLAATEPTVADALTKEAAALSAAEDEHMVRRSKLAAVAFSETLLASLDRAGQAADLAVKEAAAALDPETIKLAQLAQADPQRFLAEVAAGARAKEAEFVARVRDVATNHYLAGYEALRGALATG